MQCTLHLYCQHSKSAMLYAHVMPTLSVFADTLSWQNNNKIRTNIGSNGKFNPRPNEVTTATVSNNLYQAQWAPCSQYSIPLINTDVTQQRQLLALRVINISRFINTVSATIQYTKINVIYTRTLCIHQWKLLDNSFSDRLQCFVREEVWLWIWVAKHLHTRTHTYRFLSGCEEVENQTSQLFEPHNFPQPCNTTLLHEFFLSTTQMLEHTPTQCLPTRLPHGLVS